MTKVDVFVTYAFSVQLEFQYPDSFKTYEAVSGSAVGTRTETGKMHESYISVTLRRHRWTGISLYK